MFKALVQLTLELFGDAPLPPAATRPRAPRRGGARGPSGRRKAPRPADAGTLLDEARGEPAPLTAPEPQPALPGPPAEPLSDLLTPAVFTHPGSNRQILLEGHRVAYLLKRGRRRTIGFTVGVDGLTVSAPRWVLVGEIERALQERGPWILRKLHEMRDRATRLEAQRIQWRDGTVIPFLGEPVVIVLDPRHAFDGSALLNTAADALPGVPRLTLHVGLTHLAQPQQIRDSVQAWLMRQAHRVFQERLNHFAPALGVQWRRLSLSSAGTRWGSARSDGSIRLNWRLIHFRLPVIDYVVAHELSHLRVMDHSPRFWDTVASVMPDYDQRRDELKDESLPRWD